MKAKKSRTMLIALLVFVLIAVLFTIFMRSNNRTEESDFSGWNYHKNGTAALINAANSHGLQVKRADSLNLAYALAKKPNSLLVVVRPEWLPAASLDTLKNSEIDLMYLPVSGWSKRIENRAVYFPSYHDKFRPVPKSIAPRCSQSIAKAGNIQTPDYYFLTKESELGCYPNDHNPNTAAWLSTKSLHGKANRFYFSGLTSLLNSNILDGGQASLIYQTWGQYEQVIWYLGNPNDLLTEGETIESKLLPGIYWLLFLAFLVTVFVLGRRFTPLMSENLPTIVPATETIRGRARLYRKNKVYEHSAQIFRAWYLQQITKQIGLPRSADKITVAKAVSDLTGQSQIELTKLLYEREVNNDQELNKLQKDLANLKKEIAYGNAN
ncbi:hypothetical protein BK816_03435 [Boudabousia tangfeifanii]|uniref:DUF4350 domain-containing protein n=1 Tax=Boudabousia tangfeifanii TaxID=1912795 RepID=A0A1D9MJJ9_9ACTO|nr:hypothetical protein [Boudabousia tangfeifanii]AOZ72462.1 hypothetical protein BK816_03435 [Boudabousia tangfeifanii]